MADAGSKFRTDIEGLRAIAVGSVVIYHLWPDLLPGGYVGVDVFFVISGFLITSHLLSNPPRTAGDLGTFWVRRMRRLLPAALFVLVVTLAASRVLAPETEWANTAELARSASLYLANWSLAQDSVDYLASTNSPTPIQHYWSLSIEEQFYAVWPVLILLVALLARAIKRSLQSVTLIAVLTIFATSLVVSIRLTETNPSAAYFVTHARIWELALGGALAAWFGLPGRTLPGIVSLPRAFRHLLAWTGLLSIAGACLLFDDATPFPGWTALIPTMGTALVIAAAPAADGTEPGTLLAIKPFQWLGAVSYSLYLWHWPLFLLLPDLFRRLAPNGHPDTGNIEKVLILTASIGCAALSRKFIEEPGRFWNQRMPRRWVLAGAASAMAVVVGFASLQILEVDRRVDASTTAADKMLDDAMADPCFGAAALLNDQCGPSRFEDLHLAPSAAARDWPTESWPTENNPSSCMSPYPDFVARPCEFGSPDSSKTVALIGNSHAAHWIPPLSRISETAGWHLTAHVAVSCIPGIIGQSPFGSAIAGDACTAWGQTVIDELVARRPSLVIFAALAAGPTPTYDDQVHQLRGVFQRLLDAGIKVVMIHDTPGFTQSVPECVAENPSALDRCATPRPQDVLARLVHEIDSPELRMADLTDHLCTVDTCPGVIGGVVAYFDNNHFSRTFALTLEPPLRKALLDTGLVSGI